MRPRVLLRAGIVVAAALLVQGARADDVDSGTIARLCQHVKNRKMLVVDRSRPEIIWSDGAMIEVAKSFPSELEQLLSSPTATRDLQPMIAQIMRNVSEGGQEAKIRDSGRGETFAVVESADGQVKAQVASPYFGYLRARYPRAEIRIKGLLAPIVFMEDGVFRASVMALAMPRETAPAANKQAPSN